jgi:hypothetical protein
LFPVLAKTQKKRSRKEEKNKKKPMAILVILAAWLGTIETFGFGANRISFF